MRINRYVVVGIGFLLLITNYVQSQIGTDISNWLKSKEALQVLPDFSYAGYHSGEIAIPSPNYKVFNVVDYGAIPNDTLSDKKAIEKTIAAAEKNGSGIVFFPPGRFLVNEDMDAKTTIRLLGNNIVFRGSGSGKGGTELFMNNTLLPRNANEMWSTPPMFEFGHALVGDFIGTPIANVSEGGLTIQLSKVDNIKAGDWILLSLNVKDTYLLRQEIGNHPISPNWHTVLDNEGIIIREYHQVKSVRGNKLFLNSSIGYPISTHQPWQVFLYKPNEEIGVENIAFVGNFTKHFKHHGSWQDDSGWNMFHFIGVVNSWIQDCRFTDVSIGLAVVNSAQVSVLNCVVTGNPSHESVRSDRSTNVLIGKCADSAGTFHSIGVDGFTMNTVVWRCSYTPTTCFESHSYQPRNTLFDCVEGGLIPTSAGGAEVNHPNHLKGLVLWNYKRTDSRKVQVDFWPEKSIYEGRFSPMVIVGLHGKPTSLIEGHYKLMLSNGKKVFPESLYEYQLKKRLGFVPEWMK